MLGNKPEYNLTEARKLLGTDDKTLNRWLIVAHIKPRIDEFDRRVRYITEAQINLIATRRGRKLREDSLTSTRRTREPLSAILARLEALEKEVKELREANQPIKRAPYIPPTEDYTNTPMRNHSGETPTSSTHNQAANGISRHRNRKDRRTTQVPDMPAHLFPLIDICEAHGTHPNTARKQWHDQGIFQVEGPYKLGRSTNVWCIDNDNLRKALRHWIERNEMDPNTIGRCGIEGCNCITLKAQETVELEPATS